MEKNAKILIKTPFGFFRCYLFALVLADFRYLCGMLEKTKGIVLHSLRYGDDSLIVSIFTLSHGTLPFMVKAPKGKRSSVKIQLLRPLTILELDIDFRDRLQMQRIKDMHVALAYSTLPYEPVKEAVAMFLGEVLYHALKCESQNQPLFDFLEHSLEWLDVADHDYANFHLCLLIQLTRFLGFYPNMDTSSSKSVFDLLDGSYVDVIPHHGQYLLADEAVFLEKLLKMNYATMHRVHLNRQQRGRILRMLNTYYRVHVPDFPELKSLDILAELFD